MSSLKDLSSRHPLEFGEQGVQAVIVGLNTNDSEELLNVSGIYKFGIGVFMKGVFLKDR
jgi:hypothetical protein